MVFGSFLALASEKNSARFENFVVVQHFNDSSDVIVFVLGILAQFVPPSAPQNLAPFNLSNRAEVAVVGFGVVGRCLCVEGIFQLQPKCVCLAVGLGVRYPSLLGYRANSKGGELYHRINVCDYFLCCFPFVFVGAFIFVCLLRFL